jgi:hypothetical protein
MLQPLVIPEDLSTLTDEELQALNDEVRERAELLATDDDAIAEAGDEAAALMENALAAVEAVDGEAEKREQARAEAAEILAETRARLAQRLNPEQDDEEPEADADADAGDPEAEVVEDAEVVEEPELEPALAARPARRPARRTPAQEPVNDARQQGPKLRALASLPV